MEYTLQQKYNIFFNVLITKTLDEVKFVYRDLQLTKQNLIEVLNLADNKIQFKTPHFVEICIWLHNMLQNIISKEQRDKIELKYYIIK